MEGMAHSSAALCRVPPSDRSTDISSAAGATTSGSSAPEASAVMATSTPPAARTTAALSLAPPLGIAMAPLFGPRHEAVAWSCEVMAARDAQHTSCSPADAGCRSATVHSKRASRSVSPPRVRVRCSRPPPRWSRVRLGCSRGVRLGWRWDWVGGMAGGKVGRVGFKIERHRMQ